MKLYAFYFSPTGGTKRVLDEVLTAWDCEKHLVDLADRAADFGGISFEKDDVCLAAVPSFSGRCLRLFRRSWKKYRVRARRPF